MFEKILNRERGLSFKRIAGVQRQLPYIYTTGCKPSSQADEIYDILRRLNIHQSEICDTCTIVHLGISGNAAQEIGVVMKRVYFTVGSGIFDKCR